MSVVRKQFEKLAEEKGFDILEANWIPHFAGGEKEGVGGGWEILLLGKGSGTYADAQITGMNRQQVVEQFEQLVPYSLDKSYQQLVGYY